MTSNKTTFQLCFGHSQFHLYDVEIIIYINVLLTIFKTENDWSTVETSFLMPFRFTFY